MNVLEVDILNGFFRQSIEIQCAFGIAANHVLDVDITEFRRGLVYGFHVGMIGLVARLHRLDDGLASIVEVEGDGICLNVKHGNVADEDIAHNTSSSTATLEAQSDIRTQELTMLHEDVSDTSAHLAAYDKTAMSLEYRTSINHHILAWSSAPASVGILAALDADAVIAGIKSAVDYQCVLAGFQVQPITILGIGWITRQNVVDDDILAKQRMDVPCGRVLEDDILEQHVLAVDHRFSALEAHSSVLWSLL